MLTGSTMTGGSSCSSMLSRSRSLSFPFSLLLDLRFDANASTGEGANSGEDILPLRDSLTDLDLSLFVFGRNLDSLDDEGAGEEGEGPWRDDCFPDMASG